MISPLWIFGYGSLIWKADFPFIEKTSGYIKSYVRRFYQCSVDHRGTSAKPGRVVTLIPTNDTEAKVWGVAYRISSENEESVLRHLDHREKGGYEQVNLKFYPVDKLRSVMNSFDCITYFASERNQYFAGEADINTIARQVVQCSGISGTNKEYVYKLAESMRNIAPIVEDSHLFALEAAVRNLDNS
uniref:glutathione-specific gamma-glutamylcyclotransferase n=1 Tax=Clastoptera arizonana TaxID=38151 RepID=A0A1B6D480_9HEMI